MKQEDGNRFDQKWSDMDKSIRTVPAPIRRRGAGRTSAQHCHGPAYPRPIAATPNWPSRAHPSTPAKSVLAWDRRSDPIWVMNHFPLCYPRHVIPSLSVVMVSTPNHFAETRGLSFAHACSTSTLRMPRVPWASTERFMAASLTAEYRAVFLEPAGPLGIVASSGAT